MTREAFERANEIASQDGTTDAVQISGLMRKSLETLEKAEKIVKEIKQKKGLIELIRRDRILVVAEEDVPHNRERINDAMKELLVTYAEKEVLALEKEFAEL